MAVETERRFLVIGDSWKSEVFRTNRIRQGYLSDDMQRIIRIRTSEDPLSILFSEAWLTIKGPKFNGSGLEFEYKIPIDDADEMLGMCKHRLEKTRSLVDTKLEDLEGNIQYLRWEIDEFHGENKGLVIVEVEFDEQTIQYMNNVVLPSWIGQEITNNLQYANSNLSKYPYKHWNNFL